MPKYYNPLPEFGDCGPLEAPSREHLADELDELLQQWAEDNYREFCYDSRFSGLATDDQTAIAEVKSALRQEFLDNLEEVEDDYDI